MGLYKHRKVIVKTSTNATNAPKPQKATAPKYKPIPGTVRASEIALRHLDLTDSSSYQSIIGPNESLPLQKNPVCKDGKSRVHRLKCGHHVLTPGPSHCGNNCMDATVKESTPLHCLLCSRFHIALRKGRSPLRWHTLLLPQYADLTKEAKDAAEFGLVCRSCEPVYVPYNGGHILIPRSNGMIALIRVLEEKWEADVLTAITMTCEEHEEYSEGVAEDARQFFGHVLHRPNFFLKERPAVLAICCIQIACHRNDINPDTEKLPAKFGHTQADVDNLFQKVDDMLELVEVDEVLHDFQDHAPGTVYGGRHTKLLQVVTTARRIWKKLPKLFYPARRRRLEHIEAVVGVVITYALKRNDIRNVSLESVFDILGVEEDLKSVKWVRQTAHNLTKPKVYSTNLTRVAASKDKRVAQKQKLLQRQNETEDLSTMMTALGGFGGSGRNDGQQSSGDLPEAFKKNNWKRNEEYGDHGV